MDLLVAPVRVDHDAGWRKLWNRAVLLSLRLTVTVSRRFLAGPGRGFASIAAARLLGRNGLITFRLAGGGTCSVPSTDR
jgi:hypothetical protein